ncbi:MAG TPA: hypothetical protein VEH80_12250 [Candidatus Bathyarchaeia archaeon]|nr:hypothetical protein [Candidatus Bathyarchaeia archaeon]
MSYRILGTIALGCAAVACCGFAWPPEYAEQSRADVSACERYARETSPGFEAHVRSVDLATGQVDIERTPNDTRGEVAFSKCLLSFRQWRLIERNLPKLPAPAPPDLATMAGRPADTAVR